MESAFDFLMFLLVGPCISEHRTLSKSMPLIYIFLFCIAGQLVSQSTFAHSDQSTTTGYLNGALHYFAPMHSVFDSRSNPIPGEQTLFPYRPTPPGSFFNFLQCVDSKHIGIKNFKIIYVPAWNSSYFVGGFLLTRLCTRKKQVRARWE